MHLMGFSGAKKEYHYGIKQDPSGLYHGGPVEEALEGGEERSKPKVIKKLHSYRN